MADLGSKIKTFYRCFYQTLAFIYTRKVERRYLNPGGTKLVLAFLGKRALARDGNLHWLCWAGDRDTWVEMVSMKNTYNTELRASASLLKDGKHCACNINHGAHCPFCTKYLYFCSK